MLGPAHSASGAGAVAVTAITLPYLTHQFTSDPLTNAVMFAVGITIGAAFALVPDFDTRGKAVNSLGILGTALMLLAQGLSSVAILIRTRKDNQDGTHRTLTHTLVFAGAMYALVSLITTNTVASFVLLAISLNIALAGVFSFVFKKLEKGSPLGVYGVMILSFVVAGIMYYVVPADVAGKAIEIMPICALIGVIAHLFGDIITTSGIPLFAPIPIRGKVWYSVRLGGFISASDPIANGVLYGSSVFAVAAIAPRVIWYLT